MRAPAISRYRRLGRSPVRRFRSLPGRCRIAGPSYAAERLIQLHHQPVLDGDAPVHARGDVHVVGGDDDREAGGLHQLGERGEHVLGGARVEISGRLVGQQDARRVGDRARDRDPLLLAAGKFRRPVREALLESEIAEQIGRASRRFGRERPRIICGMITFSIAENSISKWWNW